RLEVGDLGHVTALRRRRARASRAARARRGRARAPAGSAPSGPSPWPARPAPDAPPAPPGSPVRRGPACPPRTRVRRCRESPEPGACPHTRGPSAGAAPAAGGALRRLDPLILAPLFRVAIDRVVLLRPALQLVLGDVVVVVVLGVSLAAVRLHFDEVHALAAPRALGGVLRRGVHGEHVV